MAPRIDDRWVWLGFTILISFAAINIRHCIRETVRLTELDPIQPEGEEQKHRKEEQPEDCKLPQLPNLPTHQSF